MAHMASYHPSAERYFSVCISKKEINQVIRYLLATPHSKLRYIYNLGKHVTATTTKEADYTFPHPY